MARLTQSKAPVEKQYFKSEFTQDDLEKIKKIKASNPILFLNGERTK